MTQEELNALKEEVETLNKKFAELTEEELKLVSGGDWSFITKYATRMKCENPACGEELTWEGNFMNLWSYECPYCNKMTLKGIRRVPII